jgi:hypothetical protein
MMSSAATLWRPSNPELVTNLSSNCAGHSKALALNQTSWKTLKTFQSRYEKIELTQLLETGQLI